MGLLKFGLCVVTWIIILCVPKAIAENKSLQSSETECVEGQDILQPYACSKCVCTDGKILCEEVECDRTKKNSTRSGPSTYSLNERVRPPETKSSRRKLRQFDAGNNDAIQEAVLPINLPPTAQPHVSSHYTKDSKVIEERRPNISRILTETREENVMNTYLTPQLDSNSDKYILIVPEESEANKKLGGDMGEITFNQFKGHSIGPFDVAPGFSRPLARQPLVFGRPGDKRLLMRPRHFMRNHQLMSSSRHNSQFRSQTQSENNGDPPVSIYTPGQTQIAPFGQSDYFQPKEPVIINTPENKYFVDGQVRWKPATTDDYVDNYHKPQSNMNMENQEQKNNDGNLESSQPLSESMITPNNISPLHNSNFGEMSNKNNQMWNQASDANGFPGSNSYPGNNHHGSNFGSHNAGSNYGASNFGQYMPSSSLVNNHNLNSPNDYSGKYKNLFSDLTWNKSQKNKSHKLNNRPFNQANNYYPNGGMSNEINKKKKSSYKQTMTQINKKKKKKPKQKQIMLYLDSDDENEQPNKPYPPHQGPGIPSYPKYNAQLPFMPHQNGLMPGHKPENYHPYPIPLDQNGPSMGPSNAFDYKNHKLNFNKLTNQKPFGQNMIPPSLPGLGRPDHKHQHPVINDIIELPDDILNYQPFAVPLGPDNLFPNNHPQMGKKIKNDIYSMSNEISKKKRRKKKKKKNKSIMLSTEDDIPIQKNPDMYPEMAKKIKNLMQSRPKSPNQKYPHITPELANQILSILLPIQNSPDMDYPDMGYPDMGYPDMAYPEITPEIAEKILMILLPLQNMPEEEYSKMTPQLAKKIKNILMITKKKSKKRPKPIHPMNLYKPGLLPPQHKIPLTANQYPHKPEMYPDYDGQPIPNHYPKLPKRPSKKKPFLPLGPSTEPQMYPEYDTKPMMYDYPQITEQPDDDANIPATIIHEPQMYPDYEPKPLNAYPQKPTNPEPESFYPEMYPNYESKIPIQQHFSHKHKKQKIKKPHIPLVYDYEPEIKPMQTKFVHQQPHKPQHPVTEIPILIETETYPDYEITQSPLEIDIIPEIYSDDEPKPDSPDDDLLIYPDFKPKHKEPITESPIITVTYDEPETYPDYNPQNPISEQPLIPIVDDIESQMYPNYESKPKKPIPESPVYPIILENEPEMYPEYFPKKPMHHKPQMPEINDIEPEIYIDDTPTPYLKPHPYKPKKPFDDSPIVPIILENEPEMYPDFKPKRPIEKPQIPEIYDVEPEIYVDDAPIPIMKPHPHKPKPIYLENEPEMYPDFKPEMPEEPPIFDIEPEIYIDDTPEMLNEYPHRPQILVTEAPLMPAYDVEPQMYPDYAPKPQYTKPKRPIPESPISPIIYDNEPQMYPDYEPKPKIKPVIHKPTRPVTESPINPIVLYNEPQMYPEYSPNVNQHPGRPKPHTPPVMYDIEPDIIVNNAPTMNQHMPVPKNPDISYDNEPEMYPAYEILLPNQPEPEPEIEIPEMFDEPEIYPNTESIPVFNHYPALPEEPIINMQQRPPQIYSPLPERPLPANDRPSHFYDLPSQPFDMPPQPFDLPPQPYDMPHPTYVMPSQPSNKEPEMLPVGDNIPIFNNYPTPLENPIEPDIPVFNHYPDVNKQPENYPQPFNHLPPMYPDYNLPYEPANGRPQVPHPKPPMHPNFIKQPNEFDIDFLNKIFNIKKKKPFNRPVEEPDIPFEIDFLPFGGPHFEQNIIESKKKSKIKYRPRPTKIITAEEPTRNPKRNMCKLCELLDCIHPERPLNPAIQLIDEETNLSEIIFNILSKMRKVKSKKYPHLPFEQEFDLIIPEITESFDYFKPYHSEPTDYSDGGPFPLAMEWPNNQMSSIINKFNSFKSKNHKSIFDKPHNMLPDGMPNMLPTGWPNMMAGLLPGVIPGMMPGMKPSMMPGMMAGLMPGMEPSMLPNMMPGMKPSMMPNMMPGMKPSMMPNMMPGMKPSMMPSIMPNMMSNMMPNMPFVPKLFNGANNMPNLDNFMPFKNNNFGNSSPMGFPNFPLPMMPTSMIEPQIFNNNLNAQPQSMDFQQPLSNVNMGSEPQMFGDVSMGNYGLPPVDQSVPSMGDTFLEEDQLNYTWHNPESPLDNIYNTQPGLLTDNTQAVPGNNVTGQDSNLIPEFDYFKTQSESNGTNASQLNKTASNYVNNFGNPGAVDLKALNAQRANVKWYNKGKRSDDNDLTYVRQSKGC